MELELHDFDNKFKQDIPEEEETSFINEDFDQDVENSLLSHDVEDQETSFINYNQDEEEDHEFHLIGLKEDMRLVDKRKRLKEYTGLDIDPHDGKFSKALLEDMEFTWRDDLGWSGILYRNKPVYRMSRGDMIPLPRSRIYPQFKMAVDLARDEEQKEEQKELETWLESRLKSIEDQLNEQDIKELKNITSVETLEEKSTEFRKLKHTEEDNEDYAYLEEYASLLADQLRIENNQEPEEHDTRVEQKKFEFLRKLKQSLIKYLPYGVLTGVITTIGYIIDYTIGSKSRIGVGAQEIKHKKDHDERIKEIDERIKEIKKEKQKLTEETEEERNRRIDQEIEDHIKKVEEKIRVSNVEDKEDTKLKETPITDSKPSDKETSITNLKPFQKKIPMTDLSLFVDQKEQESIAIGKTAFILGAAIVSGGIVFNFATVPIFMAATYSAGQATLIGYQTGFITYSLAAYAAAITGIKMYEFTTSETAKKLSEAGKEVNKKINQVFEKVGTALYPVGKPAYDFWYWLSYFVPDFVVNILWIIYKIIITIWNLITLFLSIPILDFLNFCFDHFAILLLCGIVFYLLFNQGSPFDLILFVIPSVLIFTMIHLGYKMKDYLCFSFLYVGSTPLVFLHARCCNFTQLVQWARVN